MSSGRPELLAAFPLFINKDLQGIETEKIQTLNRLKVTRKAE